MIFKQIESLPENFRVDHFFLPKISLEMPLREKVNLNLSKMQNTTYSTYGTTFDGSFQSVSLNKQIDRKIDSKAQFLRFVKAFLLFILLSFLILTLILWNNLHSDDYLIFNLQFITQFKELQNFFSVLKLVHANITFLQNYVDTRSDLFSQRILHPPLSVQENADLVMQKMELQFGMYEESYKLFMKSDIYNNLAGYRGLSFLNQKVKFLIRKDVYEEMTVFQFIQKVRLEKLQHFLTTGNDSSLFLLNYILVMDLIIREENKIKNGILEDQQNYLLTLYKFSFTKLGLFLVGSLAVFCFIVLKMNHIGDVLILFSRVDFKTTYSQYQNFKQLDRHLKYHQGQELVGILSSFKLKPLMK